MRARQRGPGATRSLGPNRRSPMQPPPSRLAVELTLQGLLTAWPDLVARPRAEPVPGRGARGCPPGSVAPPALAPRPGRRQPDSPGGARPPAGGGGAPAGRGCRWPSSALASRSPRRCAPAPGPTAKRGRRPGSSGSRCSRPGIRPSKRPPRRSIWRFWSSPQVACLGPLGPLLSSDSAGT